MEKEKKAIPLAVKTLYRKTILMAVALILLVAAMIFFTTAWYTKMVSTAGMSLQAAQWDYTANHTVDDVQVNVYEYTSITYASDTEKYKGGAAPGTAGWIPIRLGASQSNTDIGYILSVDRSTMSEEFQDRIFFYYLKDNVKQYFNVMPWNADAGSVVTEQMTGVIDAGAYSTATIFWEWIYEAPADHADKEAWDEFDTLVGKNPSLFVKDMNATVSIVGVEVNPQTNRVNDTPIPQ